MTHLYVFDPKTDRFGYTYLDQDGVRVVVFPMWGGELDVTGWKPHYALTERDGDWGDCSQCSKPLGFGQFEMCMDCYWALIGPL